MTSQTYRDYYRHNFFSIKIVYEKYIYIVISNHFKKRSTCHIYTGIPTILYRKSNFLYTEQYISKQCTSQQAFIVKRVLTLDKLQITKDKGQRTNYEWTKAPQYNKCWNLEFLQDNSRALAGRCLEERFTIHYNL